MHSIALCLAAIDPRAILAWCGAHPVEALFLLGAGLSLINGALPASVRAGPIGRLLSALLDRVTVLSRSDAVGTLKWPGVASQLLPSREEIVRLTMAPPEPIAPTPLRAVTLRSAPAIPPTVGPLAPPSDDGQRGSVGAGAMGFVVVLFGLLALGALLIGCPNWQRPQCSAPGAYSCAADQPMYCAAATGELTPIGDEPCSAQGRRCALSDAGVALCVRAADAAVSE